MSGDGEGGALGSGGLPEVLHFLQREWNNFARQRAIWMQDKAQLEVRFHRPDSNPKLTGRGDGKTDIELNESSARREKWREGDLERHRNRDGQDVTHTRFHTLDHR